METLFQNKIDAVILIDEENRFYFTGFSASSGCVVLSKTKKFFITDFRYAEEATAALAEFEVVVANNAGFYPAIRSCLTALGVETVGYDEDKITVAGFKTLKSELKEFSLKPVGAAILELRLIKTPQEIELIRTAQGISERALAKTLTFVKHGVTERDISAELNYELIKNGAEGLAFETIVAFGKNSAAPHHRPSDKKLEKGEVILIDFGARYGGYCSDMTRTFAVSDPSDELQKIFSIVLEAQNYALKFIKAGMLAAEADSLAREYITANGYAKEFGHSLGHGIGINIHENPRLAPASDIVLQENMVVTVEPGIYIEGLGGVRIEDMVVIKSDGVENLTTFNKNLII